MLTLSVTPLKDNKDRRDWRQKRRSCLLLCSSEFLFGPFPKTGTRHAFAQTPLLDKVLLQALELLVKQVGCDLDETDNDVD